MQGSVAVVITPGEVDVLQQERGGGGESNLLQGAEERAGCEVYCQGAIPASALEQCGHGSKDRLPEALKFKIYMRFKYAGSNADAA